MLTQKDPENLKDNQEMILQLEAQNYQIVPANFAASAERQVLSTQSVVGKTVRMKTRVVQIKRKKGLLASTCLREVVKQLRSEH